MFRIKKDFDLKELEKFGFKTFMNFENTYLIAVRDIFENGKWYRLGVNSEKRIFNKTKFRLNKCLIDVKVTKKDIQDIIQAGLIEKSGGIDDKL